MKERYINPFTDFGLKKIFGENIDYGDLKNVMDTAVEEALDNYAMEIAKNAILEGLDNQIISKLTGLSIEQIQALRKA